MNRKFQASICKLPPCAMKLKYKKCIFRDISWYSACIYRFINMTYYKVISSRSSGQSTARVVCFWIWGPTSFSSFLNRVMFILVNLKNFSWSSSFITFMSVAKYPCFLWSLFTERVHQRRCLRGFLYFRAAETIRSSINASSSNIFWKRNLNEQKN